MLFILLPGFLMAQQKLRGTVSDIKSGEPLPGTTVRLMRSHMVTTTDKDGKFELSLAGVADSLIVSFVGYQAASIAVSNDGKLVTILLSPYSHNLDAIVVSTGYQQLPKERATGSFDQIDNRLFNRSVSTDVLSHLDGVASSVLFDKRNNGVNSISVRGLSTLTSLISTPLIVVDNFPYDGDINNINPNDVESITVLKDAAAASIWGTRAGNGVIVITTKKGKYNRGLQVSVSSNVTVSAKPDLFSVPVISPADFIDLEQYLFSKGFYDAPIGNHFTYPVLSPVVELLNGERNGSISSGAADLQISLLKQHDVRTDFERYVYRNAVNQQHSISISGGSDKTNYNVSVGYDNNLQSLVGNSYDRLTVRDVHHFRLSRNLDIQAGIQYTKSNTVTDSQGGYGSINSGGGFGLYPYAQLADGNGNPLPIVRDHRASWADTAGQGKLLNWRYSPLAEIKLADNRLQNEDILLNTGLNYKFLSVFSAELKYQYENGSADGSNNYSPATYFTRNLVNTFTQAGSGGITYPIPIGSIVDQQTGRLVSHDIRGQLNYNQNLGRSGIDALIGGELSQRSNDLVLIRTYGYNAENLSVQPVDQVTDFPSYGNVAGSSRIPFPNSYSGLLNRTVSLYGNAAYSYLSRYTLSVSGRRDANNLFGVETNHKWVPLWSAGGSWVLSGEPFYHWALIPYLKLRATFGYSGNINNSIPAIATIRYQNVLPFNSLTGLPFAVISNYPNPNLQWEKTAMTNVGVDFALAGNRVSGSVEYYYKNSEDLIGQVPADPTIGAGGFLNTNSADLKTHGWDVVLNSINIRGAFEWNSNVLFSVNRNRVSKYLFTPANFNSFINSGTITSPLVGAPAESIVSYRWAGLDPANGNPVVYLNGVKSEDYSAIVSGLDKNDLVVSGSAVPQLFGSFRNNWSYKGVSLSLNISYRFDYYFRRNATSYSSLFSNWVGYNDYAKRWQQPGDELHTNVPSLVYPADENRDAVYDYSTATVEKGDNIRLQDIRLSYVFSGIKLSGSPIRAFEVFAYANNLGIIWRANKLGLDPDYGSGLPDPRSISLGFKLDL